MADVELQGIDSGGRPQHDSRVERMVVAQMDDIQGNHKIVGRFAPSPTGPLHFGSLVAALGSYLMARSCGGEWLVRIEDLDPPRVIPGSAAALLELLEALGFEWDGAVVQQSTRLERYRGVLGELQRAGLLYDCTCSRREVLASAPYVGEDGPVYPGTCRHGAKGSRAERAVRLRVPDQTVEYCDGVYGWQGQNLEKQVGDFVLYRADGQFAYQLAVVVDDIDSGVTQLVRGADLLSSTPRQIYLYRCLRAAPPVYYHLPLALGENGEKLSKRHGRVGLVSAANGATMLWQALDFLGQQPPIELQAGTPQDLLSWGQKHFSPARIPTVNRRVVFS